jgi:hypothetical protein
VNILPNKDAVQYKSSFIFPVHKSSICFFLKRKKVGEAPTVPSICELKNNISFSISQVYGQSVNENPTGTTIRYSILNKEDENVHVNLELSQPQNVE